MKREVASVQPSPKNQYLCLPWLSPRWAFETIVESDLHFSADILKFNEEAYKLDCELKPVWAISNTSKLDLKTILLRDFSEKSSTNLPVIIDAPYAGHSAMIADYSDG